MTDRHRNTFASVAASIGVVWRREQCRET